MLEIVMRLKESVTREEFDNDATYAPNVAGETPAKLQNDFGSAVVSCWDNWRMVLIVKCGGTKIDKSNLTIQ